MNNEHHEVKEYPGPFWHHPPRLQELMPRQQEYTQDTCESNLPGKEQTRASREAEHDSERHNNDRFSTIEIDINEKESDDDNEETGEELTKTLQDTVEKFRNQIRGLIKKAKANVQANTRVELKEIISRLYSESKKMESQINRAVELSTELQKQRSGHKGRRLRIRAKRGAPPKISVHKL